MTEEKELDLGPGEVKAMPLDTMHLWEQVEETDPDNTRDVKYGARKFTTVDAYAQIKRATELWGPMGFKWGVTTEILESSTSIVMKVKLRYPDGELEAFGGSRGNDGDAYKSAMTDGLTKALSYLGFNADVFLGKFDDNKYVNDLKAKKAESVKAQNNEAIEKGEVNQELMGDVQEALNALYELNPARADKAKSWMMGQPLSDTTLDKSLKMLKEAIEQESEEEVGAPY